MSPNRHKKFNFKNPNCFCSLLVLDSQPYDLKVKPYIHNIFLYFLIFFKRLNHKTGPENSLLETISHVTTELEFISKNHVRALGLVLAFQIFRVR